MNSCDDTTFVPENMPILTFGSTGAFVILLQTMLSKANHYRRSIDGIYGECTQHSVIDFQLANNLIPNGSVDCTVWSKILKVQRLINRNPNYASRIICDQVLGIFLCNKYNYLPNESISTQLYCHNLSSQPILLHSKTSTRFNIELYYSSGKMIWSYNHSIEHTNKPLTMILRPKSVIQFNVSFKLPNEIIKCSCLLTGWITTEETKHKKIILPIYISNPN